jgi:uncharacterized membrane protein
VAQKGPTTKDDHRNGASKCPYGVPTLGSYFLSLGLRALFDGIVLHQILQWRRMLTSADYPSNSVEIAAA